MESGIPDRLAALGHPQRLDIFRLLMRRYPDRVPAGEIAAALGLPGSTLSAYLSTLVQAGLLERERQGASLRYAVAMAAVQATFDHLLGDCCRGRPELCAPAFAPGAGTEAAKVPATDAAPDACPPGPAAAAAQGRRLSVLFIGSGAADRALIAQALLRDAAGDRFEAHAAGLRPAAAPHPAALSTLRARGHDPAGLRPRPLAAFRGPGAPALDFVFTICDRAANADCPAWDGRPIAGHWGVPDPALAAADAAARADAFERAYAALAERIRAFAALPLGALDRIAAQAAVDRIARGASLPA
ncbi:helix-turn-helix domain-containing protein [Rhodovulum sp. DZ06]|uniref:helix-turn-helix domain-containing protein n=1 Tax=Rhodovulum sp. DZ06 TaxID=3425126 RepID=UPI003D33B435